MITGKRRKLARRVAAGLAATGVATALFLSHSAEEQFPQAPAKPPSSPTRAIPPTQAPTQEYSYLFEPTVTPKPTVTEEITVIPGTDLTEEYTKDAFAGIRGEEELAQAPQIEGLKALWQEEKIIYQAEADNPYGLEEGEYAGEIVEYIVNDQAESGVGLVPSVLEVLVAPYNSPEAVLAGNERFPLPFDPRGREFKMGDVEMPNPFNTETKLVILGLELPVGTDVYAPIIGGSWMGEELVYHVGYSSERIPREREEECLAQGLCERIPAEGSMPSSVVERTKSLTIQVEKVNDPMNPLSIGAFSFSVSRESKALSEGEDGWQNRKKFSLGSKLFTVDTLEPAHRYDTPSYPILVAGRTSYAGKPITDRKGRWGTSTESLLQIDNRYVFILPASK